MQPEPLSLIARTLFAELQELALAVGGACRVGTRAALLLCRAPGFSGGGVAPGCLISVGPHPGPRTLHDKPRR